MSPGVSMAVEDCGADLDPYVRPPVALYVHVPFCVSLCPYCDFVVFTGVDTRGPRNRLGIFLAAVRTELALRADALDARFGLPGLVGTGRPPLETVYVGGGTPSLMPPEALAGLLALIGERYGIAADAEVTLEANPGPDERGEAASLRRAGVTRLSIGAQSLDAGELRRLGRRHSVDDVADAIASARAGGIESVNLDLLYDVPGETLASWRASLEGALGLAPDHLSLYALTLDDLDAEGITGPMGDHLPTRPGARRWRERARRAQDDERAAAQYRHAFERLAADGWLGYEISNWARPGHESRHNLVYWERRAYEAVGPGAHAFDGSTRRWNAARLDGYVGALAPANGRDPRLPPGGSERLEPAAAEREALILGLRTDRGVPTAVMAASPRAEILAWARSTGLVTAGADDRIRLTTRGRLLSNELFLRLV
jgi:putative oxygen-independent coproporphyrinogen III oxidase